MGWCAALAAADHSAGDRSDLHRRLAGLLDQIIAACLAEPFDADSAQPIGAALADLCASRPEALGATQAVLSQELLTHAPSPEVAALQPRIPMLLGALATGFARRMRVSAPPITVTFRPRVDITNYRLLIAQRQRSLGEGWESEAEATAHAVALEQIRGEIQAVARQLRAVIGELRPAGLDDLGLTLALEGYVARVRGEGGARLPNLETDLDHSGVALPKPIALCLFRVAQEALRNAIAHAQARQVSLHLRLTPEEAQLTVRDDRRGFDMPVDLSRFALADHVGLIGIAERVAGVGGRLSIETQPGAGTTVSTRVPLGGYEEQNGQADHSSAGG